MKATPVLVTGGLLGLYLNEFVRFNLDFGGPYSLNTWQSLGLGLLGGPGLVSLVWLCCSVAMSRLTGLRLKQALALDACSYWPGLLIGVSLLFSLLIGRPLSSYHAAVVLLVSMVLSLVVGLKVWLFVPHLSVTPQLRLLGPRLLLGAVVTYVVVTCLLVGRAYAGHGFWGVDLGQFDQALWNTWRGRFLQFTQYGGIADSLLTDHFEPIMILIAPLYLIWPDPRALLFLQIVVLAGGAWIAYRLALHHLCSRFASACVALAYLTHPTIINNGLDAGGSFRPDVLVIPLFLAALLALTERRWWLAGLLTVLAMACKEYIAVVVVLLGLYVLYRYRQPGLALGLVIAGVLWLVVVLGIFLPGVRGGHGSIHYQLNFGPLGGERGAAGILMTLVSKPHLVGDLLLTSGNCLAVFFYLLSLAFLPLANLPLATVGVPIVGMFMLVGVPDFFDFHLAPAFPFVFAAVVTGIARLARWGDGHLACSSRRLMISLSVVLLAASLSASIFWSSGPLGWGFWSPGRPYTYWENRFVVTDHDRRADHFAAMVPDEEPVIASDFLLLRLTQREQVYHFFDPPPADVLEQVDYAVIDLFETYILPRQTSLREVVGNVDGNEEPAGGSSAHVAGRALYRQLLSGSDFRLTAYEDGLLFLQRGSLGRGAFHYSINQVERVTPTVQMEYDFTDRLRLLGYDLDVASASLVQGQPYRVTYYWQVLEGFDDPFTWQYGVNPVDDVQQLSTDWVLIDTFTARDGELFRVVHLPTFLILPVAEWQPGMLLREEYDFVLPSDLPAGNWTWQVGMYIVPRYFPIRATVDRCVPGTSPVVISTVRVIEEP